MGCPSAASQLCTHWWGSEHGCSNAKKVTNENAAMHNQSPQYPFCTAAVRLLVPLPEQRLQNRLDEAVTLRAYNQLALKTKQKGLSKQAGAELC